MGGAGLTESFLAQALSAYREFTGKVVAAATEADPHWSRVQAGVGLLRLCALPRLLHLFRALPPEATASLAADADNATLDAYQKILAATLTTTAQKNQTALPVRLGGCGMLRFTEIRAQAWLGSWLQVLPAVRSLGGPGVASHAVLATAAQGWAASLQQATADLAAEGVYLDQAGGVADSPPAAPWLWEDGAPALE